jgi:hypothetical protein
VCIGTACIHASGDGAVGRLGGLAVECGASKEWEGKALMDAANGACGLQPTLELFTRGIRTQLRLRQ